VLRRFARNPVKRKSATVNVGCVWPSCTTSAPGCGVRGRRIASRIRRIRSQTRWRRSMRNGHIRGVGLSRNGLASAGRSGIFTLKLDSPLLSIRTEPRFRRPSASSLSEVIRLPREPLHRIQPVNLRYGTRRSARFKPPRSASLPPAYPTVPVAESGLRRIRAKALG